MNEQSNAAENAAEHQARMPTEAEYSGRPDQHEPSLTQAIEQMTRVLENLDQNSHQSATRLDAVLAAITASNENIARIGQLLARNSQLYPGMLVQERARGLSSPLSLLGIRPGGQAINTGLRVNPVLQNAGGNPGQIVGQMRIPAQNPQPAYHNEMYAQIEEVIRNTFGVGTRPTLRPVFRSPYPADIDVEHPYPANWKMPKFDKFSGEGTENTVEHVAKFTAQCREAAADPFLKLRLFNTSLTKTAFTWYISLSANSVRTWDELERRFHEQFYRTEPELSVADLALYQQRPSESVDEYLNRFKMARSRCFIRMPESEFAKMAFNGLHFKIKDHFENRYFPNLFDLGVRVAQYEQFLERNENDRLQLSRYENQNRNHLMEEQPVQEEPNPSSESEESADEAEVYA